MISSRFVWLKISWMAVLLSGCIIPESNHVEPDYYLLSPLTEDHNNSYDDVELSFYLREIELPSYLNDPRLILRPTPNTIKFRENKRWGEPLGDGIARSVSLNIQNHAPSSYFSIFPNRRKENLQWDLSIAFSAFEKVADIVSIEAKWSAKHQSGKLVAGTYGTKLSLESEGGELEEIKIFNLGLNELAKKIIESLSN